MKTWALLMLITLSEATIGVFVKLVDGRIPIQSVTFYALMMAAVLLLLAMPLVTGQSLRFPRRNIRDTVIIGVLIAAQSGFFNYAMTLVPIANAVIFWSVAPFFTFIFSWLFIGEKAKPVYLAIFAIALTGIVIAKPLSEGYMLGNLVALSVGAIYAAMITYMRHEGKTETGNDIAWCLLVAALVFSPSMFLVGPGDVLSTVNYQWSGVAIPVFLWTSGLGVISMGFAYFGISIVLKRIDANVYALIDIIVSPVVASTLGFLVFSEVPQKTMIIGGVLLLLSGFWLTREMMKDNRRRAVHPCQVACGSAAS